MSAAITSYTSSPGTLPSTSLSTTSTHGCSLTDLDLATTSLSTTSITIIPLTSIDRVRLLSGIYGPFKPPTPSSVPLWVALHLKKRKKALIVPPTWLTVESLTETLKRETTQPGFSDLPSYWIGVSAHLLAGAPDDVPNSNRVRALLKDIREARQSKILSGVGMINSVHLQMHNISAHEVAELRGFFATAFSHLKALRPPSEVEAEAKLQSELDARSRWSLLPPLPASLTAPAASTQSQQPRYESQDESMQTNFTDESSQQRQPRKSNVSDSGYYSAARPDPPSPQHGSATTRPPRFAVDEDD